MLRHRDGKSMPGGTPVLRDDATGLSKISLLRLHANEHLVISFHVHSSHSAVAHVSLEFGKLTRQTFVRSYFEKADWVLAQSVFQVSVQTTESKTYGWPHCTERTSFVFAQSVRPASVPTV